MNKKRIILIRNANHFDFGGGERFPVFLAEILKEEGFEPLIVSRSQKLRALADDHSIKNIKGWWWSRQNWSGIQTLLFPVYAIWQLILFLWYLQLFTRHKPAAIHVQSKDDFIAATFAGKMHGSRVIWTDHADLKHIWLNLGIWYKNPVGKLVYLAALNADAITVVSKSERTLVMEHLGKRASVKHKIKVVYNGVKDVAANYKISPSREAFTFCVASRLVTDKGIREVISAFDQLSQAHKNIRLSIIGDGPEAGYFKDLASRNKQISFLGHQKYPLKHIAQANVFVHPTYHEGFSVALVEASMLARPIIATSVGGNVEIIQDKNTGLLVKPKDETSLLAAMETLLNNEKLSTLVGNNARTQYEEKFNFDHIVKESFVPLYTRKMP